MSQVDELIKRLELPSGDDEPAQEAVAAAAARRRLRHAIADKPRRGRSGRRFGSGGRRSLLQG